MLDSASSPILHGLQNLALIALSLVFLPLNTDCILCCYLYTLILGSHVDTERLRNQVRPEFRPRTILVTGVGMTKGLALARNFYSAGHRVIGADFEPNGAICPGRVSRALARFYRLQVPTARSRSYEQTLLDIVVGEDVDLWVSCSGVASALEDAEASQTIERETNCRAIQLGVNDTKTLHEKHTFIEYIAEQAGLEVPETHTITSHAAVEGILHNAPLGRRYIMKTIGVVDAVRADMTLLPKSTQEETSRHLARLPISKEVPWILQEYVDGAEYCTHSLVVNGRVRAFVACPSAELLMHYKALPLEDNLTKAMLGFTATVARTGGSNFSGHVSFDFMVPKPAFEVGRAPENLTLDQLTKYIRLYPIECNPRAHTAVALFNGSASLADAYLSVLPRERKGKRRPDTTDIVVPALMDKYYWIGHDILTLLILPTISFLSFRVNAAELLQGYKELLVHLSTWRDGTFELWDPLPFWFLYQVYWPVQFLHGLLAGKKWSRINVSTLKMFEC